MTRLSEMTTVRQRVQPRPSTRPANPPQQQLVSQVFSPAKPGLDGENNPPATSLAPNPTPSESAQLCALLRASRPFVAIPVAASFPAIRIRVPAGRGNRPRLVGSASRTRLVAERPLDRSSLADASVRARRLEDLLARSWETPIRRTAPEAHTVVRHMLPGRGPCKDVRPDLVCHEADHRRPVHRAVDRSRPGSTLPAAEAKATPGRILPIRVLLPGHGLHLGRSPTVRWISQPARL